MLTVKEIFLYLIIQVKSREMRYINTKKSQSNLNPISFECQKNFLNLLFCLTCHQWLFFSSLASSSLALRQLLSLAGVTILFCVPVILWMFIKNIFRLTGHIHLEIDRQKAGGRREESLCSKLNSELR
ncbi:MAG: hypothetical protein F6K41_13095 [Symploca sp. SIO3E6]|nr:hypothetical protein [Caldora sp. SIO3E6]